eukprot:CAMPEP_0195295040 /NCGR_PEP_ID=MMETSP0707-20130614/16461_1 /TAXON_ID=33640 /ORGANISM="Asterionellopsis glacialis, Strain CCMP134" /LENGTH=51 /DNA_ID=CAMNT_0040356171 /DNA_START=67 /DNA_END=219 /DNA_ORIENTATION=+
MLTGRANEVITHAAKKSASDGKLNKLPMNDILGDDSMMAAYVQKGMEISLW